MRGLCGGQRVVLITVKEALCSGQEGRLCPAAITPSRAVRMDGLGFISQRLVATFFKFSFWNSVSVFERPHLILHRCYV